MKILGKIASWIAVNIGLPIFWEMVKRYSERKKFVESAEQDEKDKKAIEKAKKDWCK